MTPIRSLLFSGALAIAASLAWPVMAQTAPTSVPSYTQTVDSYSLPVGNLRVTSLSDGTVPQNLYELLIGPTHQHIDSLLDKDFLSNPVEASINAFLIRDGSRTILVDTGSGELFGPGYGGKLLDSLASVGVKPQQVTDVLITHIHTDHTGGLTQKGEPAFPNATIHVGEPDLRFFLEPENARKTGYDDKYFSEAAATIGVYFKLGKVKTFENGQTILPGIKATIHSGHTPGSAFFTVTSGDQSIIFVGDIIHVAAVQFPEPDVAITYDLKPEDAVQVRKMAFSDFADHRNLIAAPHLPFPGIGRIRSDGKTGFSWHPVEYRNRAAGD